ncbi:MAG: TIGR00730 family Rossman fold protein [Patescibacteria group bacterium]
MVDILPKVAPEEHRLEPELKVCDPEKTDHTVDMEGWRIMKIMAELVEGFGLLRKYRLTASIYGTARMTFNDKVYADAERLAGYLAKSGFAIITGGAGGIMRSANKGAFEAGGQSVGLNIRLPQEQGGNKFVTEEMTFNYFFTRRVMLAFASEVYIFFPGGYGTLDEFFEILTLVQTNKIKRLPIVCVGRDYWDPLVDYMKKVLLEKNKAIDPEDLELFVVVDTPEEAYEQILKLVKC